MVKKKAFYNAEKQDIALTGIPQPNASEPRLHHNLDIGNPHITVAKLSDLEAALKRVTATGGGTIHLRAGIYPLRKTIYIPSFVTLQGEGRDSTIIDFGDNNYSINVTGTSSSFNRNFRMRDITIENSGATAAVDISYAIHFILDNVRFSDNRGHGLRIRAGQQYTVFNCVSDNNDVDGFVIAGNTGAQHNRFNYFGCIATNNDGNGFSLTADPSNLVLNGAFVACEGSSNGTDGFDIFADSSGTAIEISTMFSSCIANSNTGIGFDIHAAFASFSGCTSQENGGDGFESTGIQNIFNGCTSDGNTGTEWDIQQQAAFVGNFISRGSTTKPTNQVSLAEQAMASLGNTGGNMMTNRVIAQMRNTASSTLAQGVVVVMASDESGQDITTTTTAGDDKVLGMTMFSHSNDAYGAIQTEGFTTKLKVNGTTDIAIGDYLGTYTDAGIAAKVTSGMAFAIALEAYTSDDSSGVIDALLIPPRKVGSSGSSSTTTKARAHKAADQTITTATYTKVQLDTEDYDPGSNFDNATNYRFTAPTTGYYSVHAHSQVLSLADAKAFIVAIYKNGSSYAEMQSTSGKAADLSATISDVMSLAANDYVELYVRHDHGSDRSVSGSGSFLAVHLLST